MKISSNYNNYMTLNQTRQNKKDVNFTGLTNNKLYLSIEDRVIKGCYNLVSTKPFEKLVNATNNHKNLADKLTSHLIVLGSTILSGFYVLKTVKNKDLEEDKRKTLAINQGLVWVASTIMAYTFDGWARAKFDKSIKTFLKNNIDAPPAKLANWEKGLKIARSIIIVDTVYRFIAPVIVTPLANHLGNKLRKNKSQ